MKKQNKNIKNARTFFFNELKKKGGKKKMSKKRYEKLCLDTCNLFNLTARNEKREIKIKKVNLFYQHRLIKRAVLIAAVALPAFVMRRAVRKSRQEHNKTISLG